MTNIFDTPNNRRKNPWEVKIMNAALKEQEDRKKVAHTIKECGFVGPEDFNKLLKKRS